MGPADIGAQHRPHRAKRLVDAQLVGQRQHGGLPCHDARQPPGAVGVEGYHVVQGVGHHRDRAQVLHGGDEPFACRPGLVQPILFGEEEVPQSQRGGGIIHAEPEQSHVAALDMAAERPAVGRLPEPAGLQRRIAPIPVVEGDVPGGLVHRSVSRKASRRPMSREDCDGPPAANWGSPQAGSSPTASHSNTGTALSCRSRGNSACQRSHQR